MEENGQKRMGDVIPAGIVGERVLLRAINRDDLGILRGFVNDPEVMQFSNQYHPINDLQQEQWFQEISRAHDSVWYAIVDIRSGGAKLVGTCCLVGIDWISRLAELRIRIGDRSAWGHRLGTEATQLLIRYGFLDLNLERIWLRVFASNARARRMYRRLGFQVEGTLRRAAFIHGAAEDVVLMGLLREEWKGETDDMSRQTATG